MAIEQRLDTDEISARVVSSLVLRGDISALNTEERTRYYVQMCESLGLSPAATPFAALKLNGKEILYPTRGATDQLAAIHRINRKIIDGPRVVDLAGTKLVYAVCEASHPNGRTETAVATVPLADPVNVLMKCETKAKRRATLSILGLGMLDETELDTIPASAKGPAPEMYEPAIEGPAFDEGVQAVRARLGEVVSLESAACVFVSELPKLTKGGIDSGAHGEARKMLIAHLEAQGHDAVKSKINAAITAAQDELAVEQPEFTAFVEALGQVELPGEAVLVWIKHRATFEPMSDNDKGAAWRLLCKKTEEVGKIKKADTWLRRAIKDETLRREKPEPVGAPDDRVSVTETQPETPAAPVVPAPVESTPVDIENVPAYMPGKKITELQPGEILAHFTQAVGALEAPDVGALARVWISYAKALSERAPEEVYAKAKAEIVACAAKHGVSESALEGEIKRRYAESKPPPDGPKGGRSPREAATAERVLVELVRERDVIEDVRCALDATVDLASVVAVHKEHEAEAGRQERSRELFRLCVQALAAHTGQSEERAGKTLLAALKESPKDRDFCGADDEAAWMQRLLAAKNCHEQIAAFRKRETLFRRRGLAAKRYAALVTAVEQREGIGHEDAEALVTQELAKSGAK